ncbi:hypothetical protein FQA47_011292 [Oryzias melastigma]|uniref:Uncharacterized protein n=1 Tax=Oryzias melastigma TaxID=30732 RepID=A0A834CJ04_ORYME|nr:hypothetical protein FQA47_011292 [Oryzias melastigma]
MLQFDVPDLVYSTKNEESGGYTGSSSPFLWVGAPFNSKGVPAWAERDVSPALHKHPSRGCDWALARLHLHLALIVWRTPDCVWFCIWTPRPAPSFKKRSGLSPFKGGGNKNTRRDARGWARGGIVRTLKSKESISTEKSVARQTRFTSASFIILA